mmetsp:Transcript_11136/g.22583  ORF Transcript_11136/g.22583 Transcript_11136/m.22583 type:complete len:411 (-) Transcript_11136:139-1371(-)|eukprot:CAMPEP_0113818484 /NCGR_PEP_ID=MMETSP0328-20130328/263_1 /TAXON_ID=39455 /ORGANISM="Alexandrium minutum" /LENGTH=410 /DNA_ID=CAMNT_0000786419 /DNA_START=76 /DNA_END=1308 /DNA_ORIENTATION=- /assembly_acc=CAM_ASM_000350
MAQWGTAKIHQQLSQGQAAPGFATGAWGGQTIAQTPMFQETAAMPAASWKQAAWAPLLSMEQSSGSTEAETQSQGQKRPRPACWYYQQGMCTKGANCPFPHEGGMEQAAANLFAADRLAALRPTCWYYERGCCQKGDACNFKHEGFIPQGPMNIKKLKTLEEEMPLNDTIWTAVKVALEPVEGKETEEEMRRLRSKIPQYARSSAQGMDFYQTPLGPCIEGYANNLFASLFQSLGDRPWLPQADLLLILDASVRAIFPPDVLGSVPPDGLESLIFQAHDRASDEHRAMAAVWEIISNTLQGPKTKSKVYKACEAARQQVVANPQVGLEAGAEAFTRSWIARTIALVGQATGGYPDSVLPAQAAMQCFAGFVMGGALPARSMPEVCVPEGGWQNFIASAVATAYGPQSNMY